MTTYVLVHGMWSGGHSFRRVRPLLARHGHEVFTPTLTGLGERAHLVSPQVDLSTHVQDVVNVLRYEDLREVVLLGHSYGGAVITGCLDHVADRVRHLVYLDAFVPRDGEAVRPLLGPPRDVAATLPPGDWLLPPAPREFATPEETAFAVPRRRPHPVRTVLEPVRLSRPLAEHDVTLTYVKATADGRDAPGGAAFWAAADHARTDPRWHYHEIATNHMVQHNEPEALATLLLTPPPY
ncbi:MAG: alpha/beta fold hydrolase [Pseudonocardia sp.]